jgi:hypothetical protein
MAVCSEAALISMRKILRFTLPRFIENIGLDYPAMNKEWNTYYIYRRMYNKHPNGVVGMSAIRVAVNDLNLASGEYEKMGLKVAEESDTMIKYSLFRHQELHLLSSQNDPSVNQFLTEAWGRGTCHPV